MTTTTSTSTGNWKTLLRRIGHRLHLTDPPARPSHGEQDADYYNSIYATSDEFRLTDYTRSRYYFVWVVIADRVRRAGTRSVLEIGCGPGLLAKLMFDQGLQRYLGLDFSETAIDLAREKELPGADWIVGDARTTDVYSKGEYDALICTEVLEHIEDDLLVVSKFPVGVRCIGTVPNFPDRSHVRYFAGPEEVASRYGKYFEDLDVLTLRRHDSPDGKYFLFDGVRNTVTAGHE